MDFRNTSRAPRIFPKRKFPAVLNHEYRKLDFSTTLDSLPHKRVERRDHDSKRFDPVDSTNAKRETVNRIYLEPSPALAPPFAVLQTSDESQRESPRTLESEFRSNFVEPLIDSIIETIATVHTEPVEL